jgi:para-nitrobenzyl esterase
VSTAGLRAALFLLLPALLLSAAPRPLMAQAPLLRSPAGVFEGVDRGAVRAFLGVPYAQPPVGPLRWRAPRPLPPLAGVQSATRPGRPCLQIAGIFGSSDAATFGTMLGGEDCLYLNVWTPARADRRPVVVFVPGGGGVAGAGSLNIYDGTRFAAEADAVFVTLNYRLGPFAGFRLPAIRDGDPVDDSGNYAILDTIQALRWVQQNIAAFGGDPANVTLAGQSAGCLDVYSLLESPLAAHTFSRAICMSGIEMHGTPAAAECSANALVANLLLDDGLISNALAEPSYVRRRGSQWLARYLYAKPAAAILRAQNRTAPGSARVGGSATPTDGTVIPAVRPGELMPRIYNRVPVILSTVADESELLAFFGFTRPELTQQRFWAFAQARDPGLRTSDFMRPFPSQVSYHLLTLATDLALNAYVDGLATRLAAQMPAVYRSEFLWANYPAPWSDLFHAFHGLDILFTFDSWPDSEPSLVGFVPPSEDRSRLTREMVAAVRGFIETGDPNTYLAAYGKTWRPWGASRERLRWR